jgi:HAD superfamily hydrolase (TIGR01509 family)
MKALISDVSKVLLFPKDEKYEGSLNALYKEKSANADFKFFDYFELNTELLNFYKSLKGKASVYILTSDVIQDAPELQSYWNGTVDQIFSALKMGTHKSEPGAYEAVLSKLSLKANDAIYIDDNKDNITAAKSVGLNTLLYENNEQARSEIKYFL